eukprot:GHVP01022209.1.p1 GENE.GHVP01022209.1~~GHVP01022209.1.p1  ORF type:complete len:729 (+),score=165.57 GHVP01022209.1:3529-5715(+)
MDSAENCDKTQSNNPDETSVQSELNGVLVNQTNVQICENMLPTFLKEDLQIKNELTSPVADTARLSSAQSPASSDDEVIGRVARKRRKIQTPETFTRSKSPKSTSIKIKRSPSTQGEEHEKKPQRRLVKSEIKESPEEEERLRRKEKKFRMTEANFEPLNRWWEKETIDKKVKQWNYLEHRGILFSPPHTPVGIPIKYAGVTVHLPPAAEEVALFWARSIGTPYAEKKVYVKHFWEAFVDALPEDHPIRTGEIEDQNDDIPIKKRKQYKPLFELAEFTLIKENLDREAEIKKAKTREEKLAEKVKREAEDFPYRYVLFDWIREKAGSFRSEPPGLFKGRGAHPKTGKLKRRILPMEVTINCAEEAPVPKIQHIEGQCWKDVIHQDTVAWLAFYKDSVNGATKYVFPAPDSSIAAQKDQAKYEKARKLKGQIGNIRKDYMEKMKNGNTSERQLATATYLIDRLALRVGGEKDTEEEADTVGCCSLRVEHMSFDDDQNQLTLDFLGKDSIRYFQTVQIDPTAFKNLKSFVSGKKKDALVFQEINVGVLNRYLKDFMEGLSAKVFRTYNASFTLQQEIRKLDPKVTDVTNAEDLLRFYQAANREVAILCNHQRTVPKQHETSMGKMQQQLDALDAEIERHENIQQWLINPKKVKIELTEAERKKWNEEKISKKLGQLNERKKVLGWRIQSKDDNKTIASGTSKQHYMDPRITVAFAKNYELKVEKLFSTVR